MGTRRAARPAGAPVTEAQFQRAVIDLARTLGWRVFHVPDSRRVTERGFPDLSMIHEARGRLMFAELKTAKGRVRPEQEVWMGVMKAAGAEVHLWRPDDLETVIPALLRAGGVPE